jgi:hypothetical protein
MDFEIAKTFGKGNMLGTVDVLIAKEDDLVVEQGGSDCGDRGVGQVIRQIDAVDFGTNTGA